MSEPLDVRAWGREAATAAAVRDAAAEGAALDRWDALAKPPGSLGRLEQLGAWLAGVQGTCPPRPLERVVLCVFAGDHGVAAHGVSAYPPSVTAAMVRLMAGGGAAVNALARQHGVQVRVHDLAVDVAWADGELPDAVTAGKVRRGSGSLDREDALDEEQVAAALHYGAAVADAEVDAGADLLVPGDMGIGSTTAAAAVVGTLQRLGPVDVVGRGTGVDDAGWMRKVAAVRDGLRRARPDRTDPVAVLRRVGGADLAAMTGFLLQASLRRTPVLLDGVVSGAAALAANRIAPRARHWWLAGHRSPEPAHAQVLKALSLDPVLDHGLRLGEGTGALAALPLLRSAQALLAETALLEDVLAAGS